MKLKHYVLLLAIIALGRLWGCSSNTKTIPQPTVEYERYVHWCGKAPVDSSYLVVKRSHPVIVTDSIRRDNLFITLKKNGSVRKSKPIYLESCKNGSLCEKIRHQWIGGRAGIEEHETIFVRYPPHAIYSHCYVCGKTQWRLNKNDNWKEE